MRLRNLLALAGVTLGVVGTGIAIKSLLPQRFLIDSWGPIEEDPLSHAALPNIEISFLRCGSVTTPELIAVRGALSLAPRSIAHSAVLIRHPGGTFLYDTGLATDISLFLVDQSLFFRNTLGRYTMEQPLGAHLQSMGIELDFVLLSHLHWDHVSGIPDIPGVPLRINRVEYEAARLGLLQRNKGLVQRLMGDNPVELFDIDGPSYASFRASYDLFGDGSIILVPLPGHTAGQTGMLIQRANGPGIFLIADAAWVSENYRLPATMHTFIWSRVTSDDATARQTLIDLYRFAQRHAEMPLIAMHDALAQEKFTALEKERLKYIV